VRRIFVPAIGQYDNIGDIILRRPLLNVLRPLGELHVYLGAYPAGYRAALRLEPGDVVYRSFASWYRALLAAAIRGEADYIFKPGEIQLTLRGMREHVGMLPALIAVRARRGAVLRIGAGARNRAAVARAMMRPSLALTHASVWRDAGTADYLGGDWMPDLGFAEGNAPSEGQPRPLMLVSMRGDLPMPGAAWIDAVCYYARAHDLLLHVVTQVARDDDRTRALAAALGAASLPWDGIDHLDQEEALRGLYRRAAVVASDRLHVLIAAATEGATVVAPLVSGRDKIDRHFGAAGFTAVSIVTDALSSDEIADAISTVVTDQANAPEALATARASIAAVNGRIANLISGTTP